MYLQHSNFDMNANMVYNLYMTQLLLKSEDSLVDREALNPEIVKIALDEPIEVEVQYILFMSWVRTFVLLKRQRTYKIPGKITSLPCACCRERTFEGEVNNQWFITSKRNKVTDVITYKHKECGAELDLS